MRGVIDLRDVIYFGSVILGCLYINVLVVDWKKAD